MPIEDLDGSFTIVLMDSELGRTYLYRNLAGNGFTYYSCDSRSFRFSNNLGTLLREAIAPPVPNAHVLSAYFLFRFVPGRETLFTGYYRLLPGELVTFDSSGLSRQQRQAFSGLASRFDSECDASEQVEAVLSQIVTDGASFFPDAVNLLSGGVDSSYLQVLWNRTQAGRTTYSVSVDHPRTRPDTEYALSAARVLGCNHHLVPANAPYITYLLDTIAATAEPPNHVMTSYFGLLASVMHGDGWATGICGEGADSLFGISSTHLLHKARYLRSCLPFSTLRRSVCSLTSVLDWQRLHRYCSLADHFEDYAYRDHPINDVAVFTDLPAVIACFGQDAVRDALAARRSLLDLFDVPDDPFNRLHAIGYLGEAVDSASLWTSLFNNAGCDLFCPFLDSRILRLALSIPPKYRFPYNRPKALLKDALARHLPREFSQRRKLGFGQPIFEWLAPGGQLRPWVERIRRYEFVDPSALASALQRPNWFLYSLLCYDLWHKLFIDRSLPLPTENGTASIGDFLATAC